jgi:hypothetical protein
MSHGKFPDARRDGMEIFPFFLAMCSLVVFALSCEKDNSPSLQQQATSLALDVISNSLVAPTTAKFSGVSCKDLKDNSFLVVGKVDAQNSYGAMIRETWMCAITNTGPAGLDWIVMNVGDNYQDNPNAKK